MSRCPRCEELTGFCTCRDGPLLRPGVLDGIWHILLALLFVAALAVACCRAIKAEDPWVERYYGLHDHECDGGVRTCDLNDRCEVEVCR